MWLSNKRPLCISKINKTQIQDKIQATSIVAQKQERLCSGSTNSDNILALWSPNIRRFNNTQINSNSIKTCKTKSQRKRTSTEVPQASIQIKLELASLLDRTSLDTIT